MDRDIKTSAAKGMSVKAWISCLKSHGNPSARRIFLTWTSREADFPW